MSCHVMSRHVTSRCFTIKPRTLNSLRIQGFGEAFLLRGLKKHSFAELLHAMIDIFDPATGNERAKLRAWLI